MAFSFLFLLLLSFVAFLSFSCESAAAALAPSVPPPKSLIFPVRKNDTTLQYTTTFNIGTNHSNINAVIDLGGQFVWFDCENYNSKSHSMVPCAQPKCKSAPASVCSECTGGGSDDDCKKDMCGVYIWNPFRDSLLFALLEEDTLKATSLSSSSDGHVKSKLTYHDSHHFSFTCVPIFSYMFDDLPGGTNGLVGLGRTKTSMPAQLSSSFNLPHKFAICFPTSSKDHGTGSLFVGGGPYHLSELSFIKTPLIINPITNQTIHDKGEESDEYFMNVKSIKVDGKVVPIAPSLLTIDKNGNGGSKIGTRSSYTVLETSIYKHFVSAFISAAEAMKIKRVKSVAPFGACFSARSIKQTKTGPAVPDIDLVLEGDNVVWRIYGSNSMVQSRKKNVVCLAFVETAEDVLDPSRQWTSIVLGGRQLENHLVEFDLVANKLSVSSSLLLHDTSCSHL